MASLNASTAGFSRAQLLDTQGDLMIWGGPEFALDCRTGVDPETGIRCQAPGGGTPRGLINGWVWSLDIPRYSEQRREALYQKILGYGYSHVAIDVARCAPGDSGYHGLYPARTADECARYGAVLNTVLNEIHSHGLITWCTGVTQDGPQDGLDPSLCDLVLDDWDNTDQKDCHIDAMARWFPNSLHFVEMPEGAVQPKADSCTPAGLLPTNDGGKWIRAASRRDPNFVGVALEVSYVNGKDANIAYMKQMDAWWHDSLQNRFEQDTYWKYWENYSFSDSIAYNDSIGKSVPWLKGYMSGATSHSSPSGDGGSAPFLGELDLNQAQLQHMAPDFASWPITTHISSVRITPTGVHIEMDNGRPDAWPETPEIPEIGPIVWSMGIAEQIDGVWYASAPVQLWRGLQEGGGDIRDQTIPLPVSCGSFGQIANNWFYDSRWGAMRCHQPRTGETIGIFVCAGNCRSANPDSSHSPVHERSNVVLFALPPESSGEVLISAGGTVPTPTPAPPSVARKYAPGDLFLRAGDSVRSGGAVLAFQGDGNLVLYGASGSPLWATGTVNHSCLPTTCVAGFQGDGNLVLYDGGVAYWDSGTAGRGANLALKASAPYIQILDGSGGVLFSSDPQAPGSGSADARFAAGTLALRPGVPVVLSSGTMLILQLDGNLVVYDPSGRALWDSKTPNQDCSVSSCVATFQPDGNLVLYANRSPYWNSMSNDRGGAQLVFQPNAPYLQIQDLSGRAIWSTR